MVIKYYIDGKPQLLIVADKQPEPSVEHQDRMAGIRDRIYGIYNEGYKLNRTDGGKAYNMGCKDAEQVPHKAKIVVTVNVW
jgi:hypothetical protein